MKRGILNFSEKISKGLSRPDFKFVSQMIYGILSSQSCHLSKIARTLNETISLKKTIDRLSRNLSEFSDGEKLFANGVAALTPEKKQPVGVYTRVYSATEKGFRSADEETLKALRFLGKHFKKGNIRAFDRGYDANIYYEYLLSNKEKFIIRAKKNRDVIYDGKRVNILTLANRFKGKYSLRFRKKNGIQADCKSISHALADRGVLRIQKTAV